MTRLKCSAITCVYNDNRLCSKGDIRVTGDEAHMSSETSCGSFREKGENTTNSLESGCGCHEIHIDCEAVHCTYNEHCKCTASAIQVDGGHAKNSQETCCETFERKV